MAELRIAGNFVNYTDWLPGTIGYGHLQIVLVDGESQIEFEVHPSSIFELIFYQRSTWQFTGSTSHIDDEYYSDVPTDTYRSVNVNLGGRAAEDVWEILDTVNAQFIQNTNEIIYDGTVKNSNTYVNTMLNVVGIDLSTHLGNLILPTIESYPSAELDVLQIEGDAIGLFLAGTENDDIINTGIENDVIIAGAGFDSLSGSKGNDLLDGGADTDTLSGGEGDDIFLVTKGEDVIVDSDSGDRLYIRISLFEQNPVEISNFAVPLLGGFIEDGDTGAAYFDSKTASIAPHSPGDDSVVLEYTNLYADGLNYSVYYELIDEIDQTQSLKVEVTPFGGVADSQTIIIKEFVDGDFGIRFLDNPLDDIEFGVGVGNVASDIVSAENYSNLVRELTNNGELFDVSAIQPSESGSAVIEEGSLGDDVFDGTESADDYSGLDGNDTLNGFGGDDRLYGGAGDDQVFGGSGNDILIAGSGEGYDLYDGGSGNDSLVFESTSLGVVVDLTAGTASGVEIDSDILISIETVEGGSGNDSISGDDADNVLVGGGGGDTLNGGSGSDHLYGDDGVDSLYGGHGSDFLLGGKGDDFVSGGLGDDFFAFSKGDGNDVINDGGTDIEATDRLVFSPGILSWNVSVSRSGDDRDLIVRINDTGELITLQDRLVSATGGVDEVVFEDGTVWDYSQLVALSNNTAPSAQNDGPIEIAPDAQATIQAGDLTANDSDPDSDPLTIVSVQDAVNGAVALDVDGNVVFTPTPAYSGSASFSYTVSDGNGGTATATVSLSVLVSNNTAPTAQNDGPVEIAPDAATTIRAKDLTANDFDPDGDALTILSVQDAVNGSVTLDNDGNVVFTPTPGYSGTASFSYTVSDGRGGTATAIASLVILAASASASEGPDVLVGTQAADFIDGLGGSDTIFGLDGDDTLDGGADADVLNGNGGNDSLLGEAGTDRLYGQGGNDHLNGGTGADQMFGHGGDDVYVVDDLGDIVTETENDGYDNVLVTVSGYTFAANVEAGSVQVHSGTVLSGNALNNALSGNHGDDTLAGGDGDDVIHGVAGNDVIHGDAPMIVGPQPVELSNGSFDEVFHANGTGQNGVAGWTTREAGTWNPTDSAILTPQSDENVMWLDNGGTATQVLTQTFDASARYDLTFEYGTRADWPGGSVTAELYAGSTLLGQTFMQPGAGWQAGAISVDGANFVGQDGEVLVINFVGTGSGQGQAQINNVELAKEYPAGGGAGRTSVDVGIANASFDALDYVEGTGQSGVAGWAFGNAGTWDPVATAIHTGTPDQNVMWLHDAGAYATQALSQTFDANARYIFTFEHGTRADYPGGEVTAQIFAGSTLVGEVVSAAPSAGALARAIMVNGADYAAYDGDSLTINFMRTGNAAGQAQIDNVRLTKEYATGVFERVVTDLAIVNASFDDVALAEATAALPDGWDSASAGVWNSSDAAIPTGNPEENVLYLHHNGAYASQVLTASLLTSGRYILNFEHGTRSDYAGAEVTAQLYAGSTLIGEIVSASPASAWVPRTLVVEGDTLTALEGELLSIQFVNTGTGNGQPQINNVRLSYEDTSAPLVNVPPDPAATGGDDTIYAGQGDDLVHGGAGNDRIDGGTGSDTLFGGLGDDTFVFLTAGTGADTISDFTAGAASEDTIEIATTLFADYTALSAAVTDNGTDATITIAPGDTIVLKGVLAAELHADDFMFV